MRIHRLATAVILTGSILGISVSTFALQRNGGQDRGGAQQPRQPRTAPPGGAQQPRQPRSAPPGGAQQPRQPRSAPPVHAQRELVRTPNFVPRTTGGTAPRFSPPVRTAEPGQNTNRPPNQMTARRPVVPNAPTTQAQ